MSRQIRRAAGGASQEITDVLQNVFVGELVANSPCVWIISPWLSDIPVIDNSAGGFDTFSSDWGTRPIRLSEVLSRLAQLGTEIVIATRPVDHNDHFLANLFGQCSSYGVNDLVTRHRKDEEHLHEKGILTSRIYMAGSMNLTYSGVEVNEEQITVSSDPAVIAQSRLALHRRWGGVP